MRRIAVLFALSVALSLSACGKQEITWRPNGLTQETAVKAVMAACKTNAPTWGSLLAAHYDGDITAKDAEFLSAFTHLLGEKARIKEIGIADILGASSELGCTAALLDGGKAAIGSAAASAGTAAKEAADQTAKWLKGSLQ